MESISEAIIRRIWKDLDGRAGLSLDGIDMETQKEMRDSWAKIIEEEFSRLNRKEPTK